MNGPDPERVCFGRMMKKKNRETTLELAFVRWTMKKKKQECVSVQWSNCTVKKKKDETGADEELPEQ
jgi:hypothetical protein